MTRLFGLVMLSILCIISTISTTCAVEYPQFNSAISATGMTANFDSLYSKADQLKMIHDVIYHDGKSIVWKYKDTGNWAILKNNGTIVIASPSVFSLDIKKVLNNDLTRAKDLVKSSGGRSSESPLTYYVESPYLYRVITHDFNTNIDLMLFVPECTVSDAILSVTGSDYAKNDMYSGSVVTPGQHYLIDDKEVSGCDAVYCELNSLSPGGGISCVPGECQYLIGSGDSIMVSVNPVDIAELIGPGIHKITTKGIDNQHTMKIEAVTSPSDDKMLLYNQDYTVLINESRSSSIEELYSLINITDNDGLYADEQNTSSSFLNMSNK